MWNRIRNALPNRLRTLPLRSSSDDSDVNLINPINELPEQTEEQLADDDQLLDPSAESQPYNHDLESSEDRSLPQLPDVPLLDTSQVHAASRRERALRHRSRRHRHHRSSRTRLCRCKRKETNFLASMCSMVTVVLICTSLAEPEWLYITGGRCRDSRQGLSYLGVKTFFYGWFEKPGSGSQWITPPGFDHGLELDSVFRTGNGRDNVLIDCVTPQVVLLMQSIIACCFITILLSLSAFLLDLIGFTHRILRSLRTNAVFSILSVCMCIVTNVLCFFVTERLSDYYTHVPYKYGSKVDVQFSLSFYIITAAGAMSVFAVACSLFQRPSSTSSSSGSTGSSSERQRRDRLVLEGAVAAAESPSRMWGGSACSQLAFLPPPPPYSE